MPRDYRGDAGGRRAHHGPVAKRLVRPTRVAGRDDRDGPGGRENRHTADHTRTIVWSICDRAYLGSNCRSCGNPRHSPRHAIHSRGANQMSLQTETKPTERAPNHDDTAAVMRRFNEVFLRHDPAALRDLVAADCVIENTTPAPTARAAWDATNASRNGRRSRPRRGRTSNSRRS